MKKILMGVAALASMAIAPAGATDKGNLRAGASKVDITPASLQGLTNLFQTPLTGVHDPIFVRALLIDNGINTAAIVSADVVEFGDTTQVRQRIQRELAIPVDHIFIGATHDHSAPRVGSVTPGAIARGGTPQTGAYTAFVYDKILEALKQAKASLQPARVGIGTGTADINVNRDEYLPGGWQAGFNASGPSDKTVWVVRFESAAGEPVAVLMNYAVHSTALGPENTLLSGDIAGVAESYIEQHYANKVVALWTMGAAGDQLSKYLSFPIGDQKKQPYNAAEAHKGVEAQAVVAAHEVIRVTDGIVKTSPVASIEAAERTFSCPTKAQGSQAQNMNQVRVPALDVHLGLILINHIALTAVSGEVVTHIYWRLKKESPLTHTIMDTLVNDRVGYIVDDAAYDTPIFEVKASPLERGCAEGAIVNGLVDMIEQYL